MLPAAALPRRVLSLDGGGVKGMAILLILKRLFLTVQRNEQLPEMPRPCNYFDLIGGTSTGGQGTFFSSIHVLHEAGADAGPALSRSCLVNDKASKPYIQVTWSNCLPTLSKSIEMEV